MNNNVSSIVSKLSYFTPSRYISGRIVEYDIKSANITMLKVANVISEETYQYLQSLPKMSREIEIGLLIRSNPNIFKAISSGIEKYKLKFVYILLILLDYHGSSTLSLHPPSRHLPAS